MNVLIIGSGGREHTLAYKINESDSLKNLYIAPGNAGTAKIGQNVNIKTNNADEVTQFCRDKDIDLTVIGPEQPLVDGLADKLRLAGIKVFGPGSQAAQIESDKNFAKALMQRYNVPTAAYKSFTVNDYENALNYIKDKSFPLVIKANGLAAGKGVAICVNLEEAEATLKKYLLDKKFGVSGEKILIEEFMEGEEASIFAITDGNEFYILPSSQDHKRIGENDTGENTGGMGAYAPAPLITDDLLQQITDTIIEPVINGMADDGIPFVGCLYAGLMITSDGPKVVEFNCRFGDPETQAVLPLMKGDFLSLLDSAAAGKLNKDSVYYGGGSAVCVVAASEGYPGSYEKGKVITGLEEANGSNTIVFHAGTKTNIDNIVTNGGRVLGITAVNEENDLTNTIKMAYDALEKVSFEGMYFRKDIGRKAFKHL